MPASRSLLLAAVLAALSGTAPAQVPAPATGRLLASGCFQCHGTNGVISAGFGTLAGVPAADMLGKLNDFRSKPAGSGIMVPHAQGYTPAELKAIAAYFASLPKP